MAESSSSNPVVWITGANGLIGNYLVQTAPQSAPRWRVRALTRADFDLLDFAAVEHAFVQDKPQLIIHCAAITVVSDAQKNPELARRVNVGITKFLAELAGEIPSKSFAERKTQFSRSAEHPLGVLANQAVRAEPVLGAPNLPPPSFVFFSTDLVFDGRKGNYSETDTTNPLHVYGETKLAAEEIVLKNPRHLVLRTSINAGTSLSGNRAFNEQLRRSMQSAGAAMTLFTDEFRCPIPAEATARTVWELVEKNCSGLYHVAGAEKLSRLQIGELLIQHWPEITAQIKSGSAKDFPGPPRALDTSLDISKVQKILSAPLPKFSEWLAGENSATDKHG